VGRLIKNKTLETAKKHIANKHGYKNWSELRSNTRLQDAFMYLHDAATYAIEQLESKP
jgi:hypothetical protein